MFPTQNERYSTKDSKTAIDKLPSERNSSDMSSDHGERNDSCACNQSKGDDPFIPDGIDVRADERNCDDKMREGKPIGAIGEEGIVSIGCTESPIDSFDPGKQACRFCY